MSSYKTYFGTLSVKDPTYGAVGDGSHNDTTAIQAAFDAAFGSSASPNSNTGKYNNRAVYFPPGNYKITSSLVLTSITGGLIFGSSSNSTRITYASVAGTTVPIFNINGMTYSRISGLGFTMSAQAGSIAINLDWDGAGDVSLSTNTFSDLFIDTCSTGILIGLTGNQGSENVFENVTFQGCTTAGLKTVNANALQQTVIGGGGDACGVVYHASTGSIPSIIGAGFGANNTSCIKFESGDASAAIGCRSEAANFCTAAVGRVTLIGCQHLSASNGTFIDITDKGNIVGCYSAKGKIQGAGFASITQSRFDRSDYLTGFTGVITEFVPAPLELTFATLPPTPDVGLVCNISDSNTNTWGAAITTTGAFHVSGRWNGSNWTVVGK